MILVVLLPDTSQAALSVNTNTLVFDGTTFVEPGDAKTVALFTAATRAISLPFSDVSSSILQTSGQIIAKVLTVSNVPGTTDPSLDSQPDPSLGQCICFITCTGTSLQFAQVTNV